MSPAPLTKSRLSHRIANRLLDIERRIYTSLRVRADRKRSVAPHLLTGERGEDAAFFHLRSLGYTVVARRWRSPRHPGDLDIVAWDDLTLVIVEVKTRSSRNFLPAEVAVDPHKQKMLRRMASTYLQQIPQPHRASIGLRFDVLAVYFLPNGTEFHHIPNAFDRYEPQSTSRW
jgi:putative endonuclease